MRALKKFAKSTGGNVAIMFGLAAVPLIGAGGMALDYMQATKAQSALQQAVDDAALAAGASEDEGEAFLKKLVKDSLRRNGAHDILDHVTNIKVITNSDNKIKVIAKGKIKASFMGLIGHSNLKIKATAVVGRDFGDLELVMVLDNTGSMNADGKLVALKSAAHDLVTELFDKKGSGTDLKIGLVPFSNYVNVGVPNRNKSWMDVPDDYTVDNGMVDQYEQVPGSEHNCGDRTSTSTTDGVATTSTYYGCDYDYVVTGQVPSTSTYTWSGCVDSRNYPLNVKDESPGQKITGLLATSCSRPILELTDVKTDIDAGIDAMYGSQNTYIPAGLMWGWRVLSKAAPFKTGKNYSKMSSKGLIKAIVLMTDGTNTMKASYPLHTNLAAGEVATDANALTAELCTNIKATGANQKENIKVFTIAFSVTDSVVKNLLKSCATNSSYYFDASDSAALADAFSGIAKSLITLRLAK